MRDLAINDAGDLDLQAFDFQLTDNKSDIVQAVSIILGSRKGELFFDENMGLYRENLFDKQPDFSYIEQDIVEAITKQEERVSSVDSVLFDWNKEARALKVNITITATTGEKIEIEEVELSA